MTLINDPERIKILEEILEDIKLKIDFENFEKLKGEVDYILSSNMCLKDFIIKSSDNINKEYFSYPVLVRKILEKENFTMVRYQDGEWTCMLKIEPHFTNKIPKYGPEVDKLGDDLLSIIKENPEYYISVSAGTFYERSALVWPYIKKIKNLFVGEIFRRKSVEEGLDDFIEALKGRKVIVVGPSWFGPLKELFDHIHIVSPLINAKKEFIGFKEEEIIKLEKNVSEQIDIHKDENPVVLYSCSIPAKIMSHNFYKKYGKNITQIDMGAIWDPYCGKKTRPYHEKVLNRLKK